jgi:predicted RNA polymerase sigma factor
LRALGQAAEAREAYDRAVGLSEDAAVREFLVGRSAADS